MKILLVQENVDENVDCQQNKNLLIFFLEINYTVYTFEAYVEALTQ